MAKYNLSEAEYEIMEYIWKQNCMLKFSDIMEFLSEKGHEWRKQTVQTFLTRLIEKGVLKAQKDGNYRLYYPAMSEEEYISFRKGKHEVELIDNTENSYWFIEEESGEKGWCNNFRGWIQYKYLIENSL